MTALAMIIGMVPMALGLGEAGEQNAPLGRAVIGGLCVATFATLFLVPIFYMLLRRNPPALHTLDRRFAAEAAAQPPEASPMANSNGRHRVQVIPVRRFRDCCGRIGRRVPSSSSAMRRSPPRGRKGPPAPSLEPRVGGGDGRR